MASDGRIINIHCKIFMSNQGYPLFECLAFELKKVENNPNSMPLVECDTSSVRAVKLTISGVVAECLRRLNLFSKKRWPGTNFFGLASSIYRKNLEKYSTDPADSNTSIDQEHDSGYNSLLSITDDDIDTNNGEVSVLDEFSLSSNKTLYIPMA